MPRRGRARAAWTPIGFRPPCRPASSDARQPTPRSRMLRRCRPARRRRHRRANVFTLKPRGCRGRPPTGSLCTADRRSESRRTVVGLPLRCNSGCRSARTARSFVGEVVEVRHRRLPTLPYRDRVVHERGRVTERDPLQVRSDRRSGRRAASHRARVVQERVPAAVMRGERPSVRDVGHGVPGVVDLDVVGHVLGPRVVRPPPPRTGSRS